MSNPAEFIQACNDGLLWLYCEGCQSQKNYRDVEQIDMIEDPTYLGTEPWWHDTRVFRCPDCGEVRHSTIERQEKG